MYTNENEFTSGNAKIKVVGVGGGGGNAVNRMISDGFTDAEFIVVNTDNQALENSQAKKILIGSKATRGLGAGANPEIGKKAAEENREDIKQAIEGADLIYIATGMGGGTGTGAAPVVAEIARELNILSIGIVTLPFKFEGRRRMKQALNGKKEFAQNVDTLITIPNDKILESLDEKEAESISFEQAFELADSVLSKATVGVTALIREKGHVNLDFADIRTVVKVGGSALMGIGESKGDNAAVLAAQQAMTNPLLMHGISGAQGIIMNFTSSKNYPFMKIRNAADMVENEADEDAVVLFGHIIAEDGWDEDKIEVTIVATGFEDENDELTSGTRKRTQQTVDNRQQEEVYVARRQEVVEPQLKKRDLEIEARVLESVKDLEKELNDADDLDIPQFLIKRRRG